MTLFWSLVAALLAFELVGHATAQQYRWRRIVGSCTHTCGPIGVKPSLIVCFGPSGTVDEVFCDRNTRPPYQAPEPCSRFSCGPPPTTPEPKRIEVTTHPTPQFRWSRIVGSCTHTCGPIGVKPTLIVCFGPSGTVDEIFCDRNTKPPYQAPEPCKRFPCGPSPTTPEPTSITVTTHPIAPSWDVLVGSCTATCGPTGVKPTLIVCFGPSGTVDEIFCDRNTKPPYQAPEPCNRDPCEAFPKFVDPPPYATFHIGQKVAIIEGSRLVIRARLVQGAPDPLVAWTLPDGSTPKERRGRIYVTKSGTLVVKRIQLADQGRYTATATNSVGMATVVSRVIVVSK